ncbi:MAG: Protease 3 precursor [Parcubacteria group bacterium ADurb.Bin192]|nr:MAG: Protease 3 precursor [Parcubacteria group bacterium ADurb.Bin192]
MSMENVQRTTLSNGVSLIKAPRNGARSMTLLVLVKVGSRYETPKLSGASHFIEHMMFKGTEKRPTTLHISQELDRFGAEYNAYTGKDITGYYIKIDSAQAEMAVDLLHDMLFKSRFDEHEIQRERDVIIEEIKMYEDSPRDHISELLEANLFARSPLGRGIAGTRQSVRGLNRRALMDYHRAYYVPGRLTVVVAGMIPSGIDGWVRQTFGRIAKPRVPNDQPFTCFKQPGAVRSPLALQKKKTEQTQLALSFYSLPYGHPDRYAVTLLSNILGGTMSSRLFTELREKRGLCYAIGTSSESLEDTGAFTVGVGLDHGRVEEALKAIYTELNKIIQEQVGKQELSRAKDHMSGRLALAFEDSANRAEWYGRQWLYVKKMEPPEAVLKKIKQITGSDIQRVAREILNPKRMVIAAIGPGAKPEKFKKLVNWK